ncbi:MAG: hypothetical protein ACRCT7_17365 [Shewanella sp.]
MQLVRSNNAIRFILPLLVVMVLFSALFYLVGWHKNRQVILLEYQQLFNSTYQILSEAQQIAALPNGTGIITLKGQEYSFYLGNPTPLSLLTAMNIPMNGLSKNSDGSLSCGDLTQANEVCFIPLADSMTLALAGTGPHAHAVIFPTEIKDNAWWQECMLIYARTNIEAPTTNTTSNIEAKVDATSAAALQPKTNEPLTFASTIYDHGC